MRDQMNRFRPLTDRERQSEEEEKKEVSEEQKSSPRVERDQS